ncbi:transposase DNA-binding-containing protein [Cupriavidus sp. D39]
MSLYRSHPSSANAQRVGAWVDEEFEGLNRGDPRRDRRAKELLKRFAL